MHAANNKHERQHSKGRVNHLMELRTALSAILEIRPLVFVLTLSFLITAPALAQESLDPSPLGDTLAPETPVSEPAVEDGTANAKTETDSEAEPAEVELPPSSSPDSIPPDSSESDTLAAEQEANDSATESAPSNAAPEDPEDSPNVEGLEQDEQGEATTADADVPWLDFRAYLLIGVVLTLLATASIVGQYLSRRPADGVNPALIRRYRQRINAWWVMCAILAFGVLFRPVGTITLCFLVSFWALREFITMAPTRRGDHRGLFWALVVFTPLQYILIGLERFGFTWRSGKPIDFYGLYSIVIPVYASLYLPARIAMSGDHKKFLERSAQITFGLLICVYSLSYAAALVNLELRTVSGEPWKGSPAGLLFFFILVSQVSEILQWTWGYLAGKRVIAPEINASRTWEGLIGGTLSTGLLGGTLAWVTPFSIAWAVCLSMVIGVMGFFGGMTMSAIKRDRGVTDYGTLVQGHAGVLDRIDTLCFAAPVFYHLTRLIFT